MAEADGRLALSILRQVAGEWGLTRLDEEHYILNASVTVNPAEADLLRRLNDKYA